MVKIQKLVLKNFKSFRKAEVPFANGFTAIAGSNGSGKSNVLDAMLFALGSTSLKTMRASRLTDLVNKNSPENYAKVDLFLKHDGKGYEISRMVDKQGKSVYRLDGNRVTLNEISSLLMELGIRVDGHNIVMQGDVTRVIEMSPEERRQVIDELAGLQEFDEKKEEALKNLDKVEKKIRETGIVMQERENYLADLEKEKLAAEEFGALEKEKNRLKATILFSEMEKIRKQLKENNSKTKELAAKEGEMQAKQSELEQRIRESKEKTRKLSEKITQANREMYASVGAMLEEKRSKILVNKERAERKKELIERNLARIEELGEKIKELSAEMKELDDEKAKMEAELPEIENEIASLKKKKKPIEEIYSGKQAELQEIESNARQLGQKAELLKKEEMAKQAQAEAIRQRQRIEKQRAEEMLEEKELLEKRIAELENRQRMLEAVYVKEKSPSEALAAKRHRLEKKLKESNGKQALLDALEEKASMLEKKSAECPVCESSLGENKRTMLLNKAREQVKSEKTGIARLESEEKELREKIVESEKLVEREQELRMHVRELAPSKEKNRQLGEQINAVKESLKAKTIEGLEGEAGKLAERARALLQEKEALEQKRNQFIERLQLNQLNSINTALGKAENRKSILEHRIEQITTEASARIVKEKKLLGNESRVLQEENNALEEEISQSKKQTESVEKEVKELEKKQGDAEEETREKQEKRDKVDEQTEAMYERISIVQQKTKSLEQQESQLKVENSGLEVRLADLGEEFQPFSGERKLADFDEANGKKRLEEIEKKAAGLGAINMKAIESFQELADEVNEVKAKVEKLEEEKTAVLGMIEKIEVKRTNVFMECFGELNKHFSNTFFDLFNGEGLLSLSNPETPLESGLIIEARHKGNSLQNIDSMSGGEKTLTALAFLFAIQLYEPAPFYIFDEADAALDKENSLKMVKIIKDTSRKSQFIAITHNDPLIKEADQIIGVALNKQKSSVIGLKLREQTIKTSA